MTSIRRRPPKADRNDILSETDIRGRFSYDDLDDLSRQTTEKVARVSPIVGRDDVLIEGHFHNFRCHSGMAIHTADTMELRDSQTATEIGPRLSVAVILEGAVDMELGDARFRVGSDRGPSGHLWVLTRRERWRRIASKGTRLRKVIVTVPPQWFTGDTSAELADDETLAALLDSHRALCEWTPSDRVLAAAEQIMALRSGSRLLRCMAAECRAIEIVMSALEAVVANSAPENWTTGAPRRVLTRARRIRDFLVESSRNDIPLGELASRFGMSIASMQRAFKTAYGMPINEYLREHRLKQAREALIGEGISVSEAAYRAGYSSPANFATAFRKRFGVAPSRVRG
jgi:AraC-like DNA-binding protein